MGVLGYRINAEIFPKAASEKPQTKQWYLKIDTLL